MSIYEIVEDKGDEVLLVLDGDNDIEKAKEQFRSLCIFRDKNKLRLTTSIEVTK